MPTMYLGIKDSISLSVQKEIESLSEGKSLFLQFKGEGNIRTFQNKIYSFLHRKGIKPYYRIYLEEGKILRIKRLTNKGEGGEYDILLNQEPLLRVENFVLDKLSEVENKEEAVNLILSAIKDETLTGADFAPILEEWEEKIIAPSRLGTGLETLEQTLERDKDKAKDSLSEGSFEGGFDAINSKEESK